MGVLICDEHVLFAEALASALERRGLETSVAASVQEALAIATLAPPECLVLGEGKTQKSCDGDIGSFRECCPDAWLVCITGNEQRGRGSSYAVTGCDVVLSKERPLHVLVDGVLAAPALARRHSGWPPPAGTAGVQRRPDRESLAAHFLTNREREVLRLLVLGASTSQISDSLGIAAVTARSYVQDTMTKLGVHSRLEAVRYAMHYSVV